MAIDGLFVYFYSVFYHPGHGELRKSARPSLFPQARAEVIVGKKTGEGLGKGLHVTRGYCEPRYPIEIGIGNAGRESGGDHRRSRSVGLDLHKSESLTPSYAREAEHVCGTVPSADLSIVRGRDEGHASSCAACGGKFAEWFFEGPTSDQNQVGIHVAHGPYKNVHTLVVDESAYEEDDSAPGVCSP